MSETSSKQIKVGAGVIIIKDGKILLAKRKGKDALSPGYWGSMGGHIEFGETPMEAAKREAMEELGIEVGKLKFVSLLNLKIEGKHYIDISFAGEIISGEPKIMEPDKTESIAWYPLNALPEPLFEPVKIVLEAIKTGKYYFEINQ